MARRREQPRDEYGKFESLPKRSGNRSRRKGLDGEREVAAIFRSMSATTVQNLEGGGDITVMRPFGFGKQGERLHIECKRTEAARPWAWFEQASREAPAGAVPVVAFRRSHSPWLALIALDDLARLLA